MAKKAPAKKLPVKRKPRPKKPVDISAEFGQITAADLERAAQSLERKRVYPFELTPIAIPTWLTMGLKAAALLVLGSLGGIWAAGGIDVSPGPGPSINDCLSVAHTSDRVSQVAVLHELAAQPFDGATDDGRMQAGEWFNAHRFRNRANDFGAYTDAVSEAIAANTEAALAKKLEGK